jgi:DNA-binding LacI/PurR family transcriptional regulator
MQKKHVTIADLANQLGLSPSTVSRALKNDSRISDPTKKKVWKLARSYGYRPNPHAVSLRSKTSLTVGLIIPQVDHSYFVKVLNGILSTLESAGYNVIICISSGSYDKEKEQINRLLNARVDGVLACYSQETQAFDHFQQLVQAQIPLVLFDRNTEEIDASAVISDDFQGAQLAVEHLLAQGRKRILHIQGPENLSISFYRYLGYRETLKAHGIAPDPAWVFTALDDRGKQLREPDRLIEALPQADAVFAFNDYAAYEVMKLTRKLGLKIPEALALIGFADEPMAEYLTPQLSSVRQPAYRIGRKAAEELLALLNFDQSDEFRPSPLPSSGPKLITLENELVLRDSI